MTSFYQWSVNGTEDRYGIARGYTASGEVQAECGEEALHKLLGEMPGPWDELDSEEEFTIMIKPMQ